MSVPLDTFESVINVKPAPTIANHVQPHYQIVSHAKVIISYKTMLATITASMDSFYPPVPAKLAPHHAKLAQNKPINVSPV